MQQKQCESTSVEKRDYSSLILFVVLCYTPCVTKMCKKGHYNCIKVHIVCNDRTLYTGTIKMSHSIHMLSIQIDSKSFQLNFSLTTSLQTKRSFPFCAFDRCCTVIRSKKSNYYQFSMFALFHHSFIPFSFN